MCNLLAFVYYGNSESFFIIIIIICLWVKNKQKILKCLLINLVY
jgi:hypothetical protein